MKKLLYTLITTLSFILISCDSTNKPAKGFEDEIIVVADSVEYEELLPKTICPYVANCRGEWFMMTPTRPATARYIG